MFEAPALEYLVPLDGSFRVSDASTSGVTGRHRHKKQHRRAAIESLNKLQRVLAAGDRHAVLLVFQAMDAAGKDSTIRAVMQGVDPSGCQVFSFKKPSSQELDHDFLWRTTRSLPERGRIGVFNRSYYEEVLVVRVHRGILEGQRLPRVPEGDAIWRERYESIRDHEAHLARNGTIILKFWLNVSKEEQRQRFLARLDEPEKHWKFAVGDVKERGHWDDYMKAYEDMIRNTATKRAPWYVVPADNKWFTRIVVAAAIVETLDSLNLSYPTVSDDDRARLAEAKQELLNEPH